MRTLRAAVGGVRSELIQYAGKAFFDLNSILLEVEELEESDAFCTQPQQFPHGAPTEHPLGAFFPTFRPDRYLSADDDADRDNSAS
jgi:hypothetical protein